MSRDNRKTRRARAAVERKTARATREDGSGRVHLALYRDPASGAERIALRAPLFQEAWQNEVALAVAQTARDVVGGEPSLARVVELAEKAMAAASQLADGFLQHAPPGAVACRAGCDHCCYQSVGVTPPEALAIVDFLKRTLSNSELVEFRAHVAERHAATRGLSSSQRFSPDQPCVFLRQGRCSVYEVRPLSCRGMNSLDAGECERRLREPEARAAFLATGAGSRSFMEPIRAFHAVSAGLQLALSELYGLDLRPLDLIAAVHVLLGEPASLPEAWLAGGKTFEAARGGDSTESLAILELSGTLVGPAARR